MDDRLQAQLAAWRQAALIDAATAEAIARYESAGGSAAPGHAPAAERVGPAEALTYVGVAVVLAGLVYGAFTGLDAGASGTAVLVFAVFAGVLALLLSGGGAASSRRSAGTAAAAAAGLAALGVGRLLMASGVLETAHHLVYDPAIGRVTEEPAQNLAALAAASAGACLLLTLVAVELLTVPVVAFVMASAAYAAGMASAVAIAGQAGVRNGVAPLAVGAALVLLAARPRLSRVAATLRFVAALVTPSALLVLGALPDAPVWPLIVVAAVIAVISMSAAVRLGGSALAVAGGLSVFGISVDVAGRTLGNSGGAPLVLIVSGLLLVACAALTQEAIRRTRARATAPARTP
ncbi:MAG TPA: hypothetical protein VN193_02485 [Candidatus Angelobacter sp.]|jgi:hypothetical protein|nr:hypothetical protein [Candidatus Angelobacter sp.]